MSNNQLITLNVSFCPQLQYLNISDNDLLEDLTTEGDSMLRQVVGEWNDYDLPD